MALRKLSTRGSGYTSASSRAQAPHIEATLKSINNGRLLDRASASAASISLVHAVDITFSLLICRSRFEFHSDRVAPFSLLFLGARHASAEARCLAVGSKRRRGRRDVGCHGQVSSVEPAVGCEPARRRFRSVLHAASMSARTSVSGRS